MKLALCSELHLEYCHSSRCGLCVVITRCSSSWNGLDFTKRVTQSGGTQNISGLIWAELWRRCFEVVPLWRWPISQKYCSGPLEWWFELTRWEAEGCSPVAAMTGGWQKFEHFDSRPLPPLSTPHKPIFCIYQGAAWPWPLWALQPWNHLQCSAWAEYHFCGSQLKVDDKVKESARIQGSNWRRVGLNYYCLMRFKEKVFISHRIMPERGLHQFAWT